MIESTNGKMEGWVSRGEEGKSEESGTNGQLHGWMWMTKWVVSDIVPFPISLTKRLIKSSCGDMKRVAELRKE